VGRDPDGCAFPEEAPGDGGGKVVFPEVNADARQQRDVHPVVDDHHRAGLPTPPVGGLDGLEQFAVGQPLFADLEKPDARIEQSASNVRDLAGAGGAARADRVDRGKSQRSV
jgi:hypothetical protein